MSEWIFRGLRVLGPFVLALVIFSGCTAPIREKRLRVTPGTTVKKVGHQNYQITPQDIVHVDVFQEPDMETEQRVAQDGTINIPLVGRVVIGGLTVEQASDAVEAKLRGGVLVDPQVTLNVTEYSPKRYSVLGQVNGPGAFEIPGEDVVTLPTAIAMAGGNTRIANLHRVQLTRVRNGEVYDITINLLTPEGRQFVVQKGDVIIVPESLF